MSTDAKKSLRKSMKTKLSGLSESEVAEQSRKAQQLILNLPQYQHAKRISVYLSMAKSEAQTDLIVHDAFNARKQVFVPYIHRPKVPEGQPKKRSTIEMLHLDSSQEYEELERDGWGIPSLPTDGIESRRNANGGTGLGDAGAGDGEGGLDLIIVPGVAFDRDMNRLGHGAGFYDEFLNRYCDGGKRKKPFLVSLCLAEQYFPDGRGHIPTDEHDWPVDAIAMGDGTLVTLEN